MSVESRDGKVLGQVRNVSIDPSSGKVGFVILAPEGIVASRTRLRAVPPQWITAATAKRNVLALKLTHTEWDSAPAYNLSEIASLDKARAGENIEFYEKLSPDRSDAEPDRTDGDGKSLAATGLSSRGGADRESSVYMASDLIGKSVVNKKGEKLGEVQDLLTALDQDDSVLVLFATGRLFRDREHQYLVPLRTLELEKNGRLMLDADRAVLARAKWFDETSWKVLASVSGVPRVFRYKPEK